MQNATKRKKKPKLTNDQALAVLKNSAMSFYTLNQLSHHLNEEAILTLKPAMDWSFYQINSVAAQLSEEQAVNALDETANQVDKIFSELISNHKGPTNV